MTTGQSQRLAKPISGDDYTAPTSLPLGKDSVSYTVMMAGFLGASRALILQTTHPLVAAGVAAHSDYASDPFSRLYRTFDTVTKLLYAAPEISRRQTSRMEKRHTPVTGTAADGRSYDARDRELGLWVWATLAETSLYCYERVHGRLQDQDRRRYYEEQKLFAVGCSVPLELIPDTVEDFEKYVQHVIEDDLERTDEGLDIAQFAMAPPIRGPVGRSLGRVNRWAAAALFPPKLRDIYGLDWDDARERRYRRFLRVVEVADDVLPRVLTRDLFVHLIVDRDVLMRLERFNTNRRAAAKRKARAAA